MTRIEELGLIDWSLIMIRRIYLVTLFVLLVLALPGPAQAQSLSTQQLATLRTNILASEFAAALQFTVGN